MLRRFIDFLTIYHVRAAGQFESIASSVYRDSVTVQCQLSRITVHRVRPTAGLDLTARGRSYSSRRARGLVVVGPRKTSTLHTRACVRPNLRKPDVLNDRLTPTECAGNRARVIGLRTAARITAAAAEKNTNWKETTTVNPKWGPCSVRRRLTGGGRQ